MFPPLFRSTEQEQNQKELDNARRLLYNTGGRNRGVKYSRERRQAQHKTELIIVEKTVREQKDEPTK